jgi:hypothetical protein
MTLSTHTLRLLRNFVIAVIIALTVTTAPIVRVDTINFVRTVFGAGHPAAVVRADTNR